MFLHSERDYLLDAPCIRCHWFRVWIVDKPDLLSLRRLQYIDRSSWENIFFSNELLESMFFTMLHFHNLVHIQGVPIHDFVVTSFGHRWQINNLVFWKKCLIPCHPLPSKTVRCLRLQHLFEQPHTNWRSLVRFLEGFWQSRPPKTSFEKDYQILTLTAYFTSRCG